MFALAFFLKFNGTKWSEILKKKRKNKNKKRREKRNEDLFRLGRCYAMHNK